MRPKEAGHSRFDWRKKVSVMVTIVLSITSLQVYFVRELFVAELFFALGFGILLVLVGACYLLGLAGEHGWKLVEQEAHQHSIHRHTASRARLLQPNAAGRHSSV
jgi:hypothetical protein